MPQSTHAHASELHNLAIHAHKAAAVAHDKGDHLNAHELSKRAPEHSYERLWSRRETCRRGGKTSDSRAYSSATS
jgi:hypothetical protein